MVVLANGKRELVAFSENLERGVLGAMAQMRRILATREAPGRRWVAPKCLACGYRLVCWGGTTPSQAPA
ncbi:MAG: Dna2/Cas4 domain-containing protein [Dehalococcoidia bacterium]